MVKTFRDKFGRGMGKPEISNFPKTRRIVFEVNEPKYLTGWIKIKLYDKFIKRKNKDVSSETELMELLKQNFKVTESKRKL